MTTAEPTVSLIVNTTDRAGPLQTLLYALEHQSYPHFEVIIVVGPTQDDTLEVLRAYKGRIRVLHCPEANLSRSRNIGLLAARGDIVAYIDDDAVPCRRWLEQLVRLFGDPGLVATGGAVHMIHPSHPFLQHRIGIISSLAEQVDVRSSWLEHLVPPGEGKMWMARMMGTNMAFRRPPLLRVGGFDEFYMFIAEETDLALRLAYAGQIVHPVLEAPVYHVPAPSRNRTPFSHEGRWWLNTRSDIYFCLKNGPAAGDPASAIARRCLHLVHGHWLWYRELRRARDIGPGQFLRFCAQEIRGAASGLLGGLCRKRQQLSASQIQAAPELGQPILPFQDEDSSYRPAVDPVSGDRASISLIEPPLRICLTSTFYPPQHYDGVGRLTHLMAQGLFELGHTVHVITHGDRDRVSFRDGAYVHQLPTRLDHYHRYRRTPNLYHALNRSHGVYEKVQRLVLNDGIQLLDSPIWLFEGLVTAISGMLPVAVRLVTPVREIASLQRDRDDDTRLQGDMEQALIEHASHLLPNSQATWERARHLYGLESPLDRYTIVPYGIVPAPDDEIRPFEPGHPPGTLTVLFVGRLEKRKGIADLLQAIPLVLEQVPNTRFAIAGEDNSRNDGFRHQTGMDYAEHFAHRHPRYAPRVEFTGGVSDETLQDLYRSCDLFVAPSLYESFGLVYLEAMNYAKPVIGCHSGGVPEVIDEGTTGLLVDPGQPAALAEGIVSLLSSPGRMREMGLAGRQQIVDRFSYLQMARGFEAAYRLMIRRFEAEAAGQPSASEPSRSGV
jgi:glycogen(starch) synthase